MLGGSHLHMDQKSMGVRSSDLDGQAIDPLRPMQHTERNVKPVANGARPMGRSTVFHKNQFLIFEHVDIQ